MVFCGICTTQLVCSPVLDNPNVIQGWCPACKSPPRALTGEEMQSLQGRALPFIPPPTYHGRPVRPLSSGRGRPLSTERTGAYRRPCRTSSVERCASVERQRQCAMPKATNCTRCVHPTVAPPNQWCAAAGAAHTCPRCNGKCDGAGRMFCIGDIVILNEIIWAHNPHLCKPVPGPVQAQVTGFTIDRIPEAPERVARYLHLHVPPVGGCSYFPGDVTSMREELIFCGNMKVLAFPCDLHQTVGS